MANRSMILTARIVGDSTNFNRSISSAADASKKFKDGLDKLKGPALAVGATLGLVGKQFIDYASEAEQNVGAVDAVFKNHASAIHNASSKAAKDLGLSGSSYEKYAALIGSQLKNAGVPMDQLAGKTSNLIGIGADFAAQFGGTVPDAVDAISSALKGEMDPIEKYGISLNQAKVDAEAAALGYKKVGGAFDNNAKAAAIMSLLTKQGADALGANAREAGTTEGMMNRLNATYQDLGVKLGGMLLPIINNVMSGFQGMVDWASQNQGVVLGLAAVLGGLAAVVLTVVTATAAYNTAMNLWKGITAISTAVQWAFNAAMAANPVVLVVLAVLALVAAIVWWVTQTKEGQAVWAAVCAFMTDAWNNTVSFFTSAWNGFVGFLNDALNNIGNFFSSVFAGIGSVVSTVVNGIRSFFAGAFAFVASIVTTQINITVAIIRGIINVVSTVVNFISTGFSNAFDLVRTAVSSVANFFTSSFNNISGVIQNVIGWVQSLFNGFSVPGWLRDVMNFMGGGATGFDIQGGFNLAGLETGGATGVVPFAGFFRPPTNGSTVVNNYTINVDGALDPDAVGRQLEDILNRRQRNTGGLTAAGGFR